MNFELSTAKSTFDRLGLAPYSAEFDATQPEWNLEPFVMHRIGSLGQQLFFAAVQHSGITEGNPHYQVVKDAVEHFVQETTSKSRVVVVEGGIRVCNSTPESSYRIGGEGTLTAWYATQHGIEQRSFEPVRQGEDDLFTQGFTHEEIATYIFARFVPSWHRRRLQPGKSPKCFEEFVQDRLAGTGSLLFDWPNFMRSYDYAMMKDIYETTYHMPLTPNDPATVQFLLEETTAYMQPPRSRVHQVAIAANYIRDTKLAIGLKTLWQHGISAFAAFGYTHGVTLRPFIESL